VSERACELTYEGVPEGFARMGELLHVRFLRKDGTQHDVDVIVRFTAEPGEETGRGRVLKAVVINDRV